MPLLYYWRGDNYRRDLDMGAGYHLNQANPVMHEVDLGDTLWAFTRNRLDIYVLAAALVVKAKTINPPRFRYGRYRMWGDLKLSRYFLTENVGSVEAVIRSLSVKTGGGVLGRAFQGHAAVRRITAEDHAMLAAAARTLPPEPRARIMPEDRIEHEVLLGDAAAVQHLVAETGISSGVVTSSSRLLLVTVDWRRCCANGAEGAARSAVGTREMSMECISAKPIICIGSAEAAWTS